MQKNYHEITKVRKHEKDKYEKCEKLIGVAIVVCRELGPDFLKAFIKENG